MTTSHEIPMATIVKLKGRLCCLLDPDGKALSEHVTSDGDLGLYVKPHSIAGWHLIATAFEGRTLFVPCHPIHFEVV